MSDSLLFFLQSHSLTLTRDTRTAVCYACSIACHASCDLIEIGARRAFRCDCGTSRFQGLCGSIKLGVRTCQLCPVKEKNIFNKYDGNGGHNFDGNFCKCSNSSVNFDTSIMHQCVVCEDWIHEECLGLVKMMGPFSDKEEGCIENFNENEFESIVDMEFDPKNSNFDQPSEEGVICECCIQKYPFLACIKQPDVDILNEESHESSICFCVPFKFQKGFVRLFPDWRKFICTCESCISKLESCNLAFLYTEDPLFEPEIDPDAQISSYDCKFFKKLTIILNLESSGTATVG